MRAINGVVIEKLSSTLVIRLESGLIIKVPRKKHLNIGDPVKVVYNFTNGIMKYTLPDVKIDSIRVAEPQESAEIEDMQEEFDFEEKVFCDSVDLSPVNDEYEVENL